MARVLLCYPGVYIDIVLEETSLAALVRQAAPIRIHMTATDEDRRWIELEEPSEISLVAGRGLRIASWGRGKFAIGKWRIPLELEHIEILLAPRVARRDRGMALEFAIEIEHAEIANLPALIDRGVAALVNRRLTPASTKMSWSLSEDLSTRLALPSRLEPLDDFEVDVTGASVSVTSTEVHLRLAVETALRRSKQRPDDSQWRRGAREPGV